MKNILIIIGSVATVLVLAAMFQKNPKVKIVYVDTTYLYQNCEVQKYYTKLIEDKKKTVKNKLDSLYQVSKTSSESREVLDYNFGKKKEELEYQLAQFQSEYSAKVWNQISEYTLEFGQKNGYDYIMGANGQGNLMYAKESNNISKEVLEFINKKFADG